MRPLFSRNDLLSARIQLVLGLLFGCLPFSNAQTNNPTIAACNGQQYICATSPMVELCVDILVSPQYPHANDIAFFKIDWGDSTAITTVPGSTNPPSITHTYLVDSFFNTCIYEKKFTIILETHHNNPSTEPTNSAFILTIRNPPVPVFGVYPGIPCTGSTVRLSGAGLGACSNMGINYRSWVIAGDTLSGATVYHAYPSAGVQPVQYCVGNVCDTICVTSGITVLDPAVAGVAVDSGGINIGNGNYTVCLEDSIAVLRLDGSISVNELNYSWQVEGPAGGWQWYQDSIAPDTSLIRIQFSDTGVYKITLRVDNTCDLPDIVKIRVDVLRQPPLALNPQKDTCQALLYTPSPYLDGVIYRINGVKPDSFPVLLTTASIPYQIEAFLPHICGDQLLLDTFFIGNPPPAIIAYPSEELRVCVESDTVFLSSITGGIWSGGAPHLATQAADTFFLPEAPGLFRIILSRGIGLCKGTDTTFIRVELPYPVALDTPSLGCVELDYVPSPYDPNAIYRINGQVQASFPVTLSQAGSPYTIQVTAGNVCGDSTIGRTVTIIEPEEVEILGPSDTVLCSGSPLFPLVVNDTIGFWFGQFIVSTSEGHFFQPVVPGDYTLFYQRGFDLCRRADTIQIRVVPSNAVKAGEDLVLCSTQQEVELVPGSAGGVFQGIGLTGSIVQLSALQLDSIYTYTYVVDSLPAACNSDTRTLRRLPPPSGSFDLSRDTLCQGELLTVVPSFPAGVSYSILWGDGGTLSPSLTHTYAQPGIYPIQYQAFTLNPLNGQPLCTVLDSTMVVVPEPVAPGDLNFSLSTEQGCAPLSISFENLSTNLPDYYLWEFGNGQQYFGNTPPPILFEQGIEDTLYWVRLRVPNGCGAAVLEKTIKVFAQPMANFGLSNPQPCSGALIEASLLSTGTPSTNQFFTSNGLQGTAVYNQPSYFQFYTDTIPQTIGIWLVSANACGVDTAFQSLVIQPTDVLALIGLPDTTTLCQDTDFVIYNYATPGAPIRWSISDGNTYLGDSITLHFDQPGQYELTLYAYGCGFDSVTVPITVYPAPTLSVLHDLKKCPEDPIQFQINSLAPGITLWFGDGDSTFQKNTSHLYPQPGTYFPSAQVISDRGCTTNWTGNLTILDSPIAQSAVADSICAGSPVQYAGSSNLPGSTCTWLFGDGNVAQGCLQSHVFEQSGLYTSILNVISAEGCKGNDTVPVYVRTRPTAGISYQLNNPCAKESIPFQSTSTNATGLNWQFSDGFTASSSALSHVFQQPGTYTVQLIATNEGICFDTTTLSLQLRSAPSFDIQVETPCTVQEGSQLSVLTEPSHFIQVSADTYQQTGNLHPALPAGEYQIRVVSPEGCEIDTFIQIIPPNELFMEVAQDSFSLFLGEMAYLEAIANQPAEFRWEPDLYLDNSSSPQPIATPWESVQYIVQATNALGCSKIDTLWIRVKIDREAAVFIPNAFTPNEDGTNDRFYVRSNSATVQGIDQFQVFDKYNELVFDVEQLETTENPVPENSFFGWDGTYRGQKAEAGSYRYLITIRYIDQSVQVFTGTVQLLR